jgi:hypothetical protein
MFDWLGGHVLYEGNKATHVFDHAFFNTYRFAKNESSQPQESLEFYQQRY